MLLLVKFGVWRFSSSFACVCGGTVSSQSPDMGLWSLAALPTQHTWRMSWTQTSSQWPLTFCSPHRHVSSPCNNQAQHLLSHSLSPLDSPLIRLYCERSVRSGNDWSIDMLDDRQHMYWCMCCTWTELKNQTFAGFRFSNVKIWGFTRWWGFFVFGGSKMYHRLKYNKWFNK